MQLEFHQLERHWEHLRVHHPARQRHLLASLAECGQQTPIVVVAKEQTERYVVIDGYKRIAALEQLGRDTVEAVLWPMNEADAVLLDRSRRFSEQETALEQAWLLVELQHRFGYSLEELARRFDRSTSWVSRRLALVELLPEAIQQQVRAGKIAAQVAIKFLVPAARISLHDCLRMAAIFAQHGCDTREAGQLYAAWREGWPVTRKRILQHPELFFKTQREPEEATAPAALLRDLDMAAAMVRRLHRRLTTLAECGLGLGLDNRQCAIARSQVARMQNELEQIHQTLHPEQTPYVEPEATQRDSGTEPARDRQTRDRPCAGDLAGSSAQSPAVELGGSTGTEPARKGRALPPTDSGTVQQLQGEPHARP
jgi:ParB/RepB/Spo0J family partition protein